jgi:hypothetical protein
VRSWRCRVGRRASRLKDRAKIERILGRLQASYASAADLYEMAVRERALDAGIAAKADTHDPEPVQATRRVVVVEGQAFEIVFDGVVSHGT